MKIENPGSCSPSEAEMNGQAVIAKYDGMENMRYEDGGMQQDSFNGPHYHAEYWFGTEGEVIKQRDGVRPYLLG